MVKRKKPQPCQHCRRRKVKHLWNLRPCALGRSIAIRLCGACDTLMNQRVLAFIRHPGAKRLMRIYRARRQP